MKETKYNNDVPYERVVLRVLQNYSQMQIKQKEISRLIKKNEELKETNKQLEEAYEDKTLKLNRFMDFKSLFYYRYLLAQNDVNLCKKKISCGDYLSNRKYYENMIEFYLKKILDKVV